MARITTDFTAPLIVALVADAALVIALAAGANVGSPPAVVLRFPEGPPREVRECGDGSVERLIDKVRDESNEYEVGRQIEASVGTCGHFWLDPHWPYSLCVSPRYDGLVERLLELSQSVPQSPYEDPQLARFPGVSVGGSPEARVLANLVSRCERSRSDDEYGQVRR